MSCFDSLCFTLFPSLILFQFGTRLEEAFLTRIKCVNANKLPEVSYWLKHASCNQLVAQSISFSFHFNSVPDSTQLNIALLANLFWLLRRRKLEHCRTEFNKLTLVFVLLLSPSLGFQVWELLNLDSLKGIHLILLDRMLASNLSIQVSPLPLPLPVPPSASRGNC